jgi:hypothetical protein
MLNLFVLVSVMLMCGAAWKGKEQISVKLIITTVGMILARSIIHQAPHHFRMMNKNKEI